MRRPCAAHSVARNHHKRKIQLGSRLTWNPAESLVCNVFKQLNVLHQADSCFGWCGIRNIAIHV
ncbi:hypothetical protein CSKR_110700 [Clonorchis sinensis]|uniref:Uncharacterized protein n=1 Tax=Clonorchis sinensis TaxID=79923 RepID=A0A419Q9D9_CLOSI|nr:hypothetical protein CSKR_110700 [Clonorchis sinensis]